MTDHTENNKVFNTTKILITSALALIFNYVFIIGYTLVTVLLEYPGGITKCAGLQFKENQSKWVNLTIPEPKEMSSSGPIGKSENNPEQDCRNYYTSN